jgi:hypothetical protein
MKINELPENAENGGKSLTLKALTTPRSHRADVISPTRIVA